MEVLTKEGVGGYGGGTHPGMSWWYGGGTHPGMSWWVWWRYSPRNELVGMVKVRT